MPWQNTFNLIFGPGLFVGIKAGDLLRLLRDSHFAVRPRYVLRCLSAGGASIANSIHSRIEQRAFGRRFSEQAIPPPLFVLGHWRSGTTHLHNLLSQDDRFASPNLYQVLYPHTFLTTEAVNARLMSFLVPRTRFGIDNVAISWAAPYEDEFAIAIMSRLSPYVTMALPRKHAHYDRFLTLRDVSPEELTEWKATLTTFLKKLTWKYGRPLILKSPGHTCRIRLLVEMFPDARFLHIRRNPFEVFQSTMKMLFGTLQFCRLQDTRCVNWEQRAIRQYREMFDVYFQERHLIRGGRLYEMAFEDLEADPITELRRAYRELDLPAFEHVEPRLREYTAKLRGYQKNRLTQLSCEMRKRLLREWNVSFENWHYPAEGRSTPT